MNINENVLKKALIKAADSKMGVDETISLITMYQSIVDDVMPQGVSNTPPPPQVESKIWTPTAQAVPPPVVSLVATSSIEVKEPEVGISLDEAYENMRKALPPKKFVQFEGYRAPVEFAFVPFFKEQNGNIPPQIGFEIVMADDRSKLVNRCVYDPYKPFDVQKDIQQWESDANQMYKARSTPVKAAPLPPVQIPNFGGRSQHNTMFIQSEHE